MFPLLVLFALHQAKVTPMNFFEVSPSLPWASAQTAEGQYP